MRAVREHVPEVAAAARAQHFGANHAVAGVGLLLDRVLAGRRVERGPAAARVVLRVRLEQLRSAAGAAVRPRLEDVVVLTREGRFRSLLPQHVELLARQLLTPLLL